MTTNNGLVRLSVNLAPDVAAALRGLCEQQQITITEGVRRAVAVWKFVEDEVRDGNEIFVRDPAGESDRQLVLLR